MGLELAQTELLWEGVGNIITGSLIIAGGFATFFGVLVKWGLGPPERDRWDRVALSPRGITIRF